ncbi:oxidoreductase [Paenibacillus wulumuqiensis]|uniref:oxidoreductase n=1 Tax=Paenibacillus wulumuqiensis TaxID=1567107 RepID=UPI000619429C|nr:oxidoreductase [Paenibacillus wulumuqiensis]
MSQRWTASQVPDQRGRRIIITGGSGGLGLETALELAARGAELILAVRNAGKGEQAAKQIRQRYPQSQVEVMPLDLADLDSVKAFADMYRSRYNSLDILINNAGVMIPPYQKTRQGFELQFGSNHLGHFALTGHLLPLLLRTPRARVVTLSSIAARTGYIYFNNLDGRIGYSAGKFYCQSKLANLLFAKELQKRLTEAGADTISVGCHPGIANTNLVSRGSGKQAIWPVRFAWGLFSQTAAFGALPTLYAAAEPSLIGGEFIGPDGPGSRKGYPHHDISFEHKVNYETAAKLWNISEQLTGVYYEFAAAHPTQE